MNEKQSAGAPPVNSINMYSILVDLWNNLLGMVLISLACGMLMHMALYSKYTPMYKTTATMVITNSGVDNNVYNNQQILISPYDIHNTLIHIALGEKTINNYEVHSRYGRSLLSTFEGKSRNCSTWSNIFEGECLCKY